MAGNEIQELVDVGVGSHQATLRRYMHAKLVLNQAGSSQ